METKNGLIANVRSLRAKDLHGARVANFAVHVCNRRKSWFEKLLNKLGYYRWDEWYLVDLNRLTGRI